MPIDNDITRKVVSELAAELSMGDSARYVSRATDNYEALFYYFQADKVSIATKKSNNQTRELLLKAIKLDPKFARAIAYLGLTHLFDARNKWVKDPYSSLKKAEELAHRALSIDKNVYLVHILWEYIYLAKKAIR